MTTANSVSKRNNFASSDRVAWGGGGLPRETVGSLRHRGNVPRLCRTQQRSKIQRFSRLTKQPLARVTANAGGETAGGRWRCRGAGGGGDAWEQNPVPKREAGSAPSLVTALGSTPQRPGALRTPLHVQNSLERQKVLSEAIILLDQCAAVTWRGGRATRKNIPFPFLHGAPQFKVEIYAHQTFQLSS